jgi:riboflavin kinase / FMN adenylyltransferase
VQRIDDLNDFPSALRGSAICIGNFDGVHQGHAALLEQLCSVAKDHSIPALVFTFDPHPATVLRPDRAPIPLTWVDRKIALLDRLGVDGVVLCRPTSGLLSLEARDFYDQVLRGTLAARAIVEGPNFCFGRERRGTVESLLQWCEADGIDCQIVGPVATDDGLVSSSKIRELIAIGDIDRANTMLTAPYQLIGAVERGAQRGRTLGFPTANLTDVPVLVPGFGVYATSVQWRGRKWISATHIGPNPTFGEGHRKIETHLLDFQGDLYGESLVVDFHHRLRDISKFASVDQLLQQLRADVVEVRRRLAPTLPR